MNERVYNPAANDTSWRGPTQRRIDRNASRRGGFGGSGGTDFNNDGHTSDFESFFAFAEWSADYNERYGGGSNNDRGFRYSDSGRGVSYTPRSVNLDTAWANGVDFEVTAANPTMERDLERLRNGTPREKFAAGVNAIRLGAVTSGRDDQVRFLANQLQEMDPSNAVVTLNGVQVNWITELRRSNPTMADDVYARLRERAERGEISSAQFAAYSQSFGFTPQGARLTPAEDRFSPSVVAAPNLDGAPTTTGTGTAAPSPEAIRLAVVAAADVAHTPTGSDVTIAADTPLPAAIGGIINAPNVTVNGTAIGSTAANGLPNRLAALTATINGVTGDRTATVPAAILDAANTPNLNGLFMAATPADRAAFLTELREITPTDPAQAAAYARRIAELEALGQATDLGVTQSLQQGASGTGVGGGRTLTGAELATVTFGDAELQREYQGRVDMFNQMNSIPMVGPLINMFMNMLGMGPQSFIREHADQVTGVGQAALDGMPADVRARIQDNPGLTIAPTTTTPAPGSESPAPAPDTAAIERARVDARSAATAIPGYAGLAEATVVPAGARLTAVVANLRAMGYTDIPANATADNAQLQAAVREVEANLGIASPDGQVGLQVEAAVNNEAARLKLKAVRDLQHPAPTTAPEPSTDRYDAAADKATLETAARSITIATLPAATLTTVNTRLDELVGGANLADIPATGVGQANNAVKAVETALINAGLMSGTADGILDPQVIAALQSADPDVRRILTKAFEGVTAENLTGSGVDAVIAQVGVRARAEEVAMSRG